ncbi:hypothetical protein MVEN_00272400 [Mycena venus]|uniref:Uncharacterized protein n=1 Tax=Mycena venus TaxID=2733690 RepID=A0A8H7DFD8_9AGAR|nr:hypothetical protein MVEN_00272400 [Mycena venus]
MGTTFFSAMNCAEEGQGPSICGFLPPHRKPFRPTQNSEPLSINPLAAWLPDYSPAYSFISDNWTTTPPFIDDQIPLVPWSAQRSILPFNAKSEPAAVDDRLFQFQSQLPATPLLDTLGALGLRDMIDTEYASLLGLRGPNMSAGAVRNAFNRNDWDGNRSRGLDPESANLKLDATAESVHAWTPDHLGPCLPRADVSGYDMFPDGFDIMADYIEFFFPEALVSESQDSKWAIENAGILQLLEASKSTSHRSTECSDAQDASLLAYLFRDPESVELFDCRVWTERNEDNLSLLQVQEHLDISSAEAGVSSWLESDRLELRSPADANTCGASLRVSSGMPDSEVYIHALMDAEDYCISQQTPCPERSWPPTVAGIDYWMTSPSQSLEFPEHRWDIHSIPINLNFFEESTPSPAYAFKSIGASPSPATSICSVIPTAIVGSSSGIGSGTITTTLPRSRPRRRFHRRKYIESSCCVLPPGADIDKVVSLARPFRKEGVCRWDGCSASIGLSVKDVWTHIKNAHGISEWSRTQSGLCLWPSCAHGHGRNKRLKPGALLGHLRAVHLMAHEVACPYCPEDRKPFSNRSNLKKHLLRGRPCASWAWAGNMVE